MDPATLAQEAIENLKRAILTLLRESPEAGLGNSQIGRRLGIYVGYASGNEGHISRTILGLLEDEGLVKQDSESRNWSLVGRSETD